jgi:putative hemolysin
MTDSGVGLEILLIILLVMANGLFAMSEIAVVSARKSRLQQRADAGDAKARRALELAAQPNRFLSTVQIGITLIGIFAGAYGGATVATPFAAYLEGFPAIARYGEEIALGIVVICITYLSLIVGELVPKRIALNNPERIASLVAGPMHTLSIVASPLVKLLSMSTEFILRILGLRKDEEPPVTEEEISSLIEQGTEAGVFEEAEQDLVERVFWLGDQRASSLMTPRRKIVWLDVTDDLEVSRRKMIDHRHARFLVCEGGIDQVIGMVRVKDLWGRLLAGDPLDLKASLVKPLFVPESMHALQLLEQFRESGVHLAVVVDEYGGVDGLITIGDVLDEISGDLTISAEPRVVQREDGSWLIDASLTMGEFWDALQLEDRREEIRRDYHTVGGFVFTQLGHVPTSGEHFEALGLRFEVVDMDGRRVDKVMVGEAGIGG